MKTLKILILCLLTTTGFAQQKLIKTVQAINVNKDVVIDLNTSYVEIQIETWNKDKVAVEAYIESSKLSLKELEQALKAWNLKVDGSNERVIISSNGGRNLDGLDQDDYAGLVRDLEMRLADIPELPEFPELPTIVGIGSISDMPELPEMPEMPEFPELPELPKGIKTISFDYEKYQKEGEAYLTEWSKKYEKEGGKDLQKSMEAWARKFAKSGYQEKMKKWGETYGERFEGKWAKDMEKWGEKFGETYGKDLEKWGEAFGEAWGEKMEAWGERLTKAMEESVKNLEKDAKTLENDAKRLQKRAELIEKRKDVITEKREKRSLALEEKRELRKRALEDRMQQMRQKREGVLIHNSASGNDSKVRKVIKIKIPKKAKLKTNIRHGELKITSVIYNMSGDISHSFLVAEHIDGSDTSINVSYSPVVINTWNLGTLNLNFVDKANIKNAKHLVLNAKSSNINIENLLETGIIDGSFGDLTISNLATHFKTLNLILETSDALISLPKNTDYTLYFKGNRSKYNNKPTTQKTIRNYPEGQTSDKNIIVNAKFSTVIMN
ncbi:hypothetical protein [uncultured Winogradskyella sp.]|uniref:hypothetical protein n=1 Tax=uncultured Winogradskyella sp. TaxID=395353 RepID=UPI0030D6D729